MNPNKKIFVVTGSQTGVGFGIVKSLATISSNYVVFLTDIQDSLLEQTVKQIKKQLGNRLKANVRCFQLDVTNKSSIIRFANHLKSEFGGFDVLINNAAIRFRNTLKESLNQAKRVLETNYRGVRLVTETLLPLMKNGGRIVILASRCGMIKSYPMLIKKKLSNDQIKIEDIDEFVEDFLKAFEACKVLEMGYPHSSYTVSKTTNILLAMIWSRELKQRNIVVNACCPGFVNTGTGMGGLLSIEEAADTPVYLATMKEAKPNGKFLYKRKILEWY